MARRRHSIPQRRRVFVGAEGQSERSFAAWLQHLCNESNLHLHLDIGVCGGGDSRVVVEFSGREKVRREREYGRYRAAFVLLDSDRLQRDIASGRSPPDIPGLDKVWLRPNLEGLLLRLHNGEERTVRSAVEVGPALRRRWPDYDKPPAASLLSRRFSLTDLRRAASYDADLSLLLEQLGLLNR